MEEDQQVKSGRNYRRRRRDSAEEDKSDDEEDPTLAQVEEARAVRQMKKKKHGVDITAIIPQSGNLDTEHLSADDPLRLRSGGGLANMAALHAMTSDAAAATTSSIGTAFAAETKRRDEDLELLRYVEEEMGKRRGADTPKEASSVARPSNPRAMLYELPEYLKVTSKQKKSKEENMSSQMLTGIPEVELGIEAKMKNIEETETAKQKLWEEMRGSKEEASEFVPTNYAVNFVQHNRWSSGTTRVAPTVQAAFAASAARRATENAAKAAEAAAAAAKIVVQISEPGSEGVRFIPPRPVEDPKPKHGRHRSHHHHHRHDSKNKKKHAEASQTKE